MQVICTLCGYISMHVGGVSPLCYYKCSGPYTLCVKKKLITHITKDTLPKSNVLVYLITHRRK